MARAQPDPRSTPQRRAALLDVAAYDRRARPHRRRRRARRDDLRHRPPRCSSPPRARRGHAHRLRRRAGVASATLNGVALDVSRLHARTTGSRCPTWPPRTARRRRRLAGTSNTGEGLHRFVDPVDGAVYLYTPVRDGRRQADVRLLRPARPQGHASPSRSPRPPTGRSSPTRRPHGRGRRRRRAARTASPTTERSQHLPRRADRRARTHSGRRDSPTTGIPLGIYCRASLAEHLDADGCSPRPSRASTSSTATSAPVPVRQVRPAVRARVQRRRDGERRRGDLPRGLRLPLAGSPGSTYERRAETMLHEMAHMWFGDLVTMRWWDDLWLNESFATFASACSARPRPPSTPTAWTTFANVEKSWAYAQDQLPSTHPIAADIPDLQAVEVNFDGITYAKGASVLKQLVAYVGLRGVPGRAARLLRRPTRAATPRSPTCSARWSRPPAATCPSWAAQWLQTTGLNTLRPVVRARPTTAAFARFDVVQGGARPGAGELRTHRLAVGLYDDDGRQARPHPPGRAGRRRASAPRCPSWSARRAADARAGQRRRPHLRQAPARRAARWPR